MEVKRNQWEAWIYLAPTLILMAIFTVYPLFNTFSIAFQEDYRYMHLSGNGNINFSNFNFSIRLSMSLSYTVRSIFTLIFEDFNLLSFTIL